MTDAVIRNAIAKRDAAIAEARRWDDFIRMYREVSGGAAQDAASIQPRRERQQAQATADGAIAETSRAASDILRRLGRPVNTRELLGLLLEHGMEVGGKDPTSTLSARLSRAPELVNIRGKGWWLRESADDSNPTGDVPSADLPHSGPVEPGREVAHDNIARHSLLD